MNITHRSVRASSVLAALLTAAMALHAQPYPSPLLSGAGGETDP